VAVGRTICHAVSMSARPSIVPLSKPRLEMVSIEPLLPYYLGLGKARRTIEKLTGRY